MLLKTSSFAVEAGQQDLRALRRLLFGSRVLRTCCFHTGVCFDLMGRPVRVAQEAASTLASEEVDK